VLTVETLAPAGGAFRSRTTLGERVVELKGSLKEGGGGHLRISVTFLDNAPGSNHEVTTNVMVTPGKAHVIGKLVGGGRERSVVLIIVNDAAEDEAGRGAE
jgi:hypothetical protein